MAKWYRTIKEANSLAKSLKIEPKDELYRDVQRFEKNLKEDGHWQELLQMRKGGKSIGKVQKELENIIESYKAQRINDTLMQNSYTEHVGKSVTGGDWYLIKGDPEFKALNKTIENTPKTPEYQEYIKNLSQKLEEMAVVLRDHACGGGWCISQGDVHQASYLKNGNSFLFLRRDEKPRASIVFKDINGNNSIVEVQGPSNKIDSLDALDVIDLENAPFFSFDEIVEAKQEELDAGEEDETRDAYDILSSKLIYIDNPDLIKNPEFKKQIDEAIDSFVRAKINRISRGNSKYYLQEVVKLIMSLQDYQYSYSKIVPQLKAAFQSGANPNDILLELSLSKNQFRSATGVKADAAKKELLDFITYDDIVYYINNIEDIYGLNRTHTPEVFLANSIDYLQEFFDIQLPEGFVEEIKAKISNPMYNSRAINFVKGEGIAQTFTTQEEFDFVLNRALKKSRIDSTYLKSMSATILNFYSQALEHVPQFTSLERYNELLLELSTRVLEVIEKRFQYEVDRSKDSRWYTSKYSDPLKEPCRAIWSLIYENVYHPDIKNWIQNQPFVVNCQSYVIQDGQINQVASSWYRRKK